MSAVATNYEHIILNEHNEPVIVGAGMKVIQLVLDKIAYGWSPEELMFQHPHLTLGQIYSALAYYYDHQDEIDREIERQLKHIQQLRQASRPSPWIRKHKAR